MNEEIETELNEEIIMNTPSRLRRLILFFAFALLASLFLLVVSIMVIIQKNTASNDFPTDKSIVIRPGTDVRSITQILADENVVRSASLLYYTILLFHDPTTIKASTYIFDEPLTTYEVAKKLSEGDFDTNLVRLTHIEGERASKLAARATEVLPQFDAERFITAAEEQEGKLFPETYLIPPDYTDKDLLELLLSFYEDTMIPLRPQIAESGLTEEEVITLASIIEREANSSTSKKMVAGVFLNRLEIGMALQADATIEYVLDKPISELRAGELAENLEEMDTPYNSYRNPGLPPTPIGNPGYDSIIAVLEPYRNGYLYYITGNDGEFYYAETYDEHLMNIQRHLK